MKKIFAITISVIIFLVATCGCDITPAPVTPVSASKPVAPPPATADDAEDDVEDINDEGIDNDSNLNSDDELENRFDSVTGIDWKDAYINYIENHSRNIEFTLVDVGFEYPILVYRPSQPGTKYIVIYTNGKVHELDNFGSLDGFSYEDGFISLWNMGGYGTLYRGFYVSTMIETGEYEYKISSDEDGVQNHLSNSNNQNENLILLDLVRERHRNLSYEFEENALLSPEEFYRDISFITEW